MELLATLLSALRTAAEALKPSALAENGESEAYDSVKQALGMVSGPLCEEISAFIFAYTLDPSFSMTSVYRLEASRPLSSKTIWNILKLRGIRKDDEFEDGLTSALQDLFEGDNYQCPFFFVVNIFFVFFL